MKLSLKSIFTFLGTTLLILLFFISSKSVMLSKKESAIHDLPLFKKTLSSQKAEKDFFTQQTATPPSSLSAAPAPLYEPSEEELTSFPGAVVIEAIETEGIEPHQKIHLRILKTHFSTCSASSGLIRTEEVINEQTGELVDRMEMLADHLLVRLPPNEDPQQFLQQLGARATSITRIIANDSLYNVTLAEGTLSALPQTLEAATAIDGITAEPDFIAHTTASNIPNYFTSFFALKNQWGLWEDCGGINVYPGWQIQSGAPSVIVAVVDSGIRYTHHDLADNMWSDPAEPKEGCLHGIDAIIENGDAMDIGDGHGTHCAGIIGGRGTSLGPLEMIDQKGLFQGIFGVAPQVQLMACRGIDSSGVGTNESLIKCIDYAIRHGATILNCSFSISYTYSKIFPTVYFSNYLFEAFQKARDAGAIVVAPAGNAAIKKNFFGQKEYVPNNNDKHPVYPASFPLDNIVSVAASNCTYTFLSPCLSPDSNYGPETIDIAAPGVSIYSTYYESDCAYKFLSGTSMATAFVSGSLALLKEHYPQASYHDLINHLLANTDWRVELSQQVKNGHLNIGKALQAPLLK